MSSNTYTLKIAVDDSKIKEIEKRLMNVVGGGTVGGATASTQGGIGKNLGKLGLIAAGVTAIVTFVSKIAAMTVDASPILQTMLKLLNVGVMFILRPIGDFFGFFLRPLVIFFLRTIALPWYRQVTPIMRQLGTWLGDNFIKNLQSNFEGATALLQGDFQEAYDMANEQIQKDIKAASVVFEDLSLKVSTWIEEYALPEINSFSDKITKFVDDLGIPSLDILVTKISEWIEEYTLPPWTRWITRKIAKWITDSELPTWDDLVNTITDWMSGLNLPSFSDLTEIINNVKKEIQGVIESIKNFFLGIWNWLSGGANNGGSGDTNITNNIYGGFETAANYVQTGLNDLGQGISEALGINTQGSNG